MGLRTAAARNDLNGCWATGPLVPWMTGADVFAEERREESAARFVEKQTDVWDVGWHLQGRA